MKEITISLPEVTIGVPDGYEFDWKTRSIVPIKNTIESTNSTIEYIDLGLPSGTLWATCNIGASRPEKYGDYFTFDKIKEYNCPSNIQFNELISNCKWVWVKLNNIQGHIVIGKNSNYIFLPASGYHDGTFRSNVNSSGYYWSNSPCNLRKCESHLFFHSNTIYLSHISKSCSCFIRTVKNK